MDEDWRSTTEYKIGDTVSANTSSGLIIGFVAYTWKPKKKKKIIHALREIQKSAVILTACPADKLRSHKIVLIEKTDFRTTHSYGKYVRITNWN